MKDFIIDRDEVMVSFDISSLFTNVTIDEASDVMKSILQQDDSLQERTSLCPDDVILLLNTCLTSTYFSYKNLFYQQKEGTAMGSPVSPIVANLFMEYFEHLALTSAPYVPRLWKRYVDDIFCIMKKSQVNSFLQHLNSIRPSIKFSMELETNGCLPFLDTLLSRKDDGYLNITVYRKSTHTDRYLNFNSHHPHHVKKGLIRCLYDRAKNVTISPIDLKQEQHHLLQVLQHNGYPANFIHSTLPPSLQSSSLSTSTPDTFCASIVLPYISGLSEDIRRICKGYNIRVSFKSGRNLRNMLCKVKHPIPKEHQSHLIYQIPCACGKTYIGETKRRLATRLKEHKELCRKMENEKSAVAEHTWSNQKCNMDWDGTRILAHASTTLQLRMKEALHIQLNQQHLLINRDEGMELSKCWASLMKTTTTYH
ncbi:uncharacterized protein LOC134193468 [Corticium candelabrum]|uniref:uncharacterized protein LOC134193468 n=1 Tax=Corticium candelabrum TaxID=121492 RepID=UPI002E2672C1|nr:uncharacterized protein LOC134193468 [Corticium candelabrum]